LSESDSSESSEGSESGSSNESSDGSDENEPNTVGKKRKIHTTDGSDEPPAKTQAVVAAKAKPKPKPKAASKPKPQPKPNPKARPKAQLKTTPKAAPKVAPKAAPKAAPKPQPKARSKARPGSDTEMECDEKTKDNHNTNRMTVPWVVTEAAHDTHCSGYTRNSSDDVYDCIRHTISANIHMTMSEDTVELDTVLSRAPYQQMLETLFHGNEKVPDNIPVISRIYEESFMRECINGNEKPCVMGKNCECMFIDQNIPFVGTEFVLPGETTSEQAQLCVLCSRKVTQQLFHDMVFRREAFRAVIQRYGNICEQIGEYARECMLICPPNSNVQCMPFPIVAHQRNRYSVVINNGVKYLRQHRVYMEDFTNSQIQESGFR
jgi:hypothetical protein